MDSTSWSISSAQDADASSRSESKDAFRLSLKKFAYENHKSNKSNYSSASTNSSRNVGLRTPNPTLRSKTATTGLGGRHTSKEGVQKPSAPARRALHMTASSSALKLCTGAASTSSATTRIASKKLRKRVKGYAPPERYAHLGGVPDYLSEDLDVMFCGINPGTRSAETGHHFAHPSNHFYKMLYGAGFTDRLISPKEDASLPSRYNIGCTNLVSRASLTAAELSQGEMVAAVPDLLRKIAKYRPRFVCFVGIGIWRMVRKGIMLLQDKTEDNSNNDSRALSPSKLGSSTSQILAPQASSSSPTCKRKQREDERVEGTGGSSDVNGVGLQLYKVVHPESGCSPVSETLFFVTPSSSGLVTHFQLSQKIEAMKHLQELVQKHKDGTIDTSNMQYLQAVDFQDEPKSQ